MLLLAIVAALLDPLADRREQGHVVGFHALDGVNRADADLRLGHELRPPPLGVSPPLLAAIHEPAPLAAANPVHERLRRADLRQIVGEDHVPLIDVLLGPAGLDAAIQHRLLVFVCAGQQFNRTRPILAADVLPLLQGVEGGEARAANRRPLLLRHPLGRLARRVQVRVEPIRLIIRTSDEQPLFVGPRADEWKFCLAVENLPLVVGRSHAPVEVAAIHPPQAPLAQLQNRLRAAVRLRHRPLLLRRPPQEALGTAPREAKDGLERIAHDVAPQHRVRRDEPLAGRVEERAGVLLLVEKPRRDARQLAFRLHPLHAVHRVQLEPGEPQEQVGEVEPVFQPLRHLVPFGYPNNRRVVRHLVIQPPHPPHDLVERLERVSRPFPAGERGPLLPADELLPPGVIVDGGRDPHAEGVADPLRVGHGPANQLPRLQPQAPASRRVDGAEPPLAVEQGRRHVPRRCRPAHRLGPCRPRERRKAQPQRVVAQLGQRRLHDPQQFGCLAAPGGTNQASDFHGTPTPGLFKLGNLTVATRRFPKSSPGKNGFPVNFPGTFLPCFLVPTALCRENDLPRSLGGHIRFLHITRAVIPPPRSAACWRWSA